MANSEQIASGEPDDHLARAIAMDAICDVFEDGLMRGEGADIRAELDRIEPEGRPELFKQ